MVGQKPSEKMCSGAGQRDYRRMNIGQRPSEIEKERTYYGGGRAISS